HNSRTPLSPPPNLFFSTTKLTSQSKYQTKRPTIRLVYDALPTPASTWPALTIKSGAVVVKGIRFVVDARAATEVVMAAVQLQDGSVHFEDCEFVQVRAPEFGTSRVSSLEIGSVRNDSGEPVVTATRCRFVGMQRA